MTKRQKGTTQNKIKPTIIVMNLTKISEKNADHSCQQVKKMAVFVLYQRFIYTHKLKTEKQQVSVGVKNSGFNNQELMFQGTLFKKNLAIFLNLTFASDKLDVLPNSI